MKVSKDFRYQLESPRLTGRRQQKTACPQCGRQRCFVRYVDTQHEFSYVDPACGRCDHEQSCGYHLRPSELFRDQPWRRQPSVCPTPPPPKPRPLMTVPDGYVSRSHSAESTFWQWFIRTATQQLGVSADTVRRVYDDYLLGATRAGDVIFWQVDCQCRVRSGHIMHYDADGHRSGYQGWAHARLIRQGVLPPDFELTQCLFGEHLLRRRPDATVCLVESEKTALLMAAVQPQHLWLATCGSSGLSADKLRVLQGRRVVVFPDSGCLDKWHQRLADISDLSYTISTALEGYPPNTDLADLLLTAPTDGAQTAHEPHSNGT